MDNKLNRGISRAYRFRFYPTLSQERQMAREFGNARWVWNFSLRAMSDTWTDRKQRLNWIALA